MSRPGFFWRKWLEGSSRWIYVGMCPVEMLEGSESAVVGRAGDKFVLYISAPSRRWDGEGDLFKGAGPRVQGLFSAKPVLIKGSLGMLVEGPHSGAFKPLCIPPLGGSRWWVFSTMDWSFFEEHGLNYPPGDHALYVLTESGISQYCSPCHEFNSSAHSLCKFAFGGKWLYHSPVGPPVSAPGAGALNDAELSVIRFRDRYLRVGEWIAWHRVLGILDDGKWVIIGDDGLYEAVFRPTAKNLAEDFGEVDTFVCEPSLPKVGKLDKNSRIILSLVLIDAKTKKVVVYGAEVRLGDVTEDFINSFASDAYVKFKAVGGGVDLSEVVYKSIRQFKGRF
ncbi:MAG: hypothetical protein QXI84_07505 [Thermofilaceae archaeon]